MVEDVALIVGCEVLVVQGELALAADDGAGALVELQANDAGNMLLSVLEEGVERIGQGRDKAVAFLEENPDIAAKIEDGIRKLAATGEVGETFELDEEFDLSGLDEE